MKITKTKVNTQNKKGFSLVEMLVVIAIIGIMAAVAVPKIGAITEKAKQSRNKRNAQIMSSMIASALAAGACNTYYDSGGAVVKECLADLGACTNGSLSKGLDEATIGSVMKKINTGCEIKDPESPLLGTIYSAGNMSQIQMLEAAYYLVQSQAGLIEVLPEKSTTGPITAITNLKPQP